MKHKQIMSLLLLTAYLMNGMPLAALAVTAPLTIPPPGNVIPTGIEDIEKFRTTILTIANWVFAFLLVIAVIYMLVGAFGYLSSGGDAEAQTNARNRIVYGLVGVAVGTMAIALVNIITKYFGGGAIVQ